MSISNEFYPFNYSAPVSSNGQLFWMLDFSSRISPSISSLINGWSSN